MNLRLLLTLVFVGSLSLSLTAQPKGYSIKMKVNGVKDDVVQLGNYYGDKQYLKDSAKVDSQGRFVFEGKEKLDGGIYLVIMPDKRYFEIIMDSIQHFSVETDTEDYVKNFKVKGSKENELFYDYMNYINPRGKKAEELRRQMNDTVNVMDEAGKAAIKEELTQIDKEVIAYKKSIQDKHPQTFVAKMFKAMDEIEIPEAPVLDNGQKDSTFAFRYYRAHYWDNIDFTDDRILRTPIYHNKLKRYLEQLTMQVPDSINKTADGILGKAKASPELFKYTLWYITNTYERSNVMGMDAVFVHMVENYYSKGMAHWVDEKTLGKIEDRAKILSPLLIGKVAPQLMCKDTNDRYVPLHSVKGKYTILYFWDPDCGHCKKITPKVFEVYEKYKAKGLAAYAVCTDRDPVKFKKFIIEKNLNWINVNDPAPHYNLKEYYDIYSTPVIYLLNEKKEIIAKRLGVEQLEDLLEREFGKIQ